ncbi:hypothetical protein D3C78_1655660 [compost metagenome]
MDCSPTLDQLSIGLGVKIPQHHDCKKLVRVELQAVICKKIRVDIVFIDDILD